MSSGKVVLGTLAGFAIGAIAGILLAPEKGSKTRKKIMGLKDDYLDDVKSKFEEFRENMSAKMDDTKKEVDDMMQKGKSKYDEVKKDVKGEPANGKHVTL